MTFLTGIYFAGSGPHQTGVDCWIIAKSDERAPVPPTRISQRNLRFHFWLHKVHGSLPTAKQLSEPWWMTARTTWANFHWQPHRPSFHHPSSHLLVSTGGLSVSISVRDIFTAEWWRSWDRWERKTGLKANTQDRFLKGGEWVNPTVFYKLSNQSQWANLQRECWQRRVLAWVFFK